MKVLQTSLMAFLVYSQLVSTSWANQNLDQMSEKLIQLRGEVEQLNNEINFLKDEHKQEMNFIWSQKNEVKSEIERNKKLISRLKKELEKAKTKNLETGLSAEQLLPEFKQSIVQVRDYVNTSMPFKKQERLAALDEIDHQVTKELISVQRGFNKLWAFVEDEIRLTKESGLYQASIQLSNQDRKQLVDVARIGMMKMYFKTQEGQFGQVSGQPGTWSYELIEKESDQDNVKYLFDSMQKQIRTGLFVLPIKRPQ